MHCEAVVASVGPDTLARNTLALEIKQAQEARHRNDYTTAIQHYEKAVDVLTGLGHDGAETLVYALAQLTMSAEAHYDVLHAIGMVFRWNITSVNETISISLNADLLPVS